MNSDNHLQIEQWGEIFKGFRQVESVKVISSADRLDINISGREETLQATGEDLDDSLSEFKSNPHEVVTDFLKNHGIIVYYQNTLVGFFDIHAYSQFIEKTNIEDAINKMSNFFNSTGSVANTDILALKFDHWILSDSIIIVVDTNRHPLFSGSVESFLGTCSSIMEDAMMNCFPLRGAIGGGDFYKDGEVMVSSALVDAASYEKEQKWLGAVLTPQAIKMIEKAKELEVELNGKTRIDFHSERFNPFIRYGTIPWKKKEVSLLNKPDKAYYIKPFSMNDKDWASKYLPSYFNDQEKVDNSHCLYAQD